MNVQSDTSLDDESGIRRTRPTTGYALSLVIAGAEIDEAQLAAAIADIGAEVRSSETVEGGLKALVACSGTAQQAEVLSIVEKVDGVDSVSSSDTTFDLHVDGKIVVSPRIPIAAQMNSQWRTPRESGGCRPISQRSHLRSGALRADQMQLQCSRTAPQCSV